METASYMLRCSRSYSFKDWNLPLVPTVAMIRADVVRFLTNARLYVIMDGRTLDEVRGGMSDPATLGRRRTNRLEQYDSWIKYITYMKKPDNYAGTLFMFGFSALYNVSVRIVSDSYDEPYILSRSYNLQMRLRYVSFHQRNTNTPPE